MKIARVQAVSANFLWVSVAESQQRQKFGHAFPQLTLYTKKRYAQVVFVQHGDFRENETNPLASSSEPCIIFYMGSTQRSRE
jgi:hypothetical protein